MNMNLARLPSSVVLVLALGRFSAACHGTPGPATPASADATVEKGRAEAPPSLSLQAVVEAADRDAGDLALDRGRHPAELLAFFGVAPGMKVAEIGAGGGYTTELLARVVGVDGVVYGENSKLILSFAGKAWTERLQKPIMKKVVRVDRELDEPLPPEATGLDLVINAYTYHDTVWMKVDRDKMNAAIFAALKHGGIYGIADHSARPGSGLADVQTLHRIDEDTLKQEIARAGFRVQAEGDFLRNPSDARDWNDSPRAAAERRGTSDRFVIRFVKP